MFCYMYVLSSCIQSFYFAAVAKTWSTVTKARRKLKRLLLSVCIMTFEEKLWAVLEQKHFSNLLARHWDREYSKVKGMMLSVSATWDSGVRRSGPLFKCHCVCWGMCNYGGQAFDPGFPSGLNCPHIERCSVSLGTPLYSAALSCAPLWNSKHRRLKSELWPVLASLW